jgi:hypothetical protein
VGKILPVLFKARFGLASEVVKAKKMYYLEIQAELIKLLKRNTGQRKGRIAEGHGEKDMSPLLKCGPQTPRVDTTFRSVGNESESVLKKISRCFRCALVWESPF